LTIVFSATFADLADVQLPLRTRLVMRGLDRAPMLRVVRAP
jgi:hypothetical protein